jgi:ATP-binding cassette subfamily C (CFTR/MRP) protein 1
MWAEYNERFPNQKLGYYLGIYAMLGGVAFIFLIVSCWYVFLAISVLQLVDPG